MKYIAAVSLMVVLTLCGCNKLTHIPFDYDYHTSINVPAAPIPGVTDSFPATIPTNIDSILQAKGTNANLLQSAKLSALTLTITTPPGQTFAFIKDIQIFVVNGSTEVEIAHKFNVSSTSSSLPLDVDDVELKPYLTAESMTLKVLATTQTGMTTNMTVYFDMKVHFEANLLAAL